MTSEATSAGVAAPFLAGLHARSIVYQRCMACGRAQTLAHYACTTCGSPALTWQIASGQGRVYATTTIARAPSEDYAALVPYTLALVDMEEGFRLLGHAAPEVAITDDVIAGFFEHAGRTLLWFTHPIVA